MMKQFHSLPDPAEVGLRWKAYQEAREKIARVEERYQEAQLRRQELEGRIREQQSADVAALARSILAGDADPAASTEELEDLAGELREQRRLTNALEQALPQAEDALRQTVFEHQEVWTSQVDKALMKALEEERAAYTRAQEIAQKARSRRLYLEALSDWTRKVSPSFSAPADVTVVAAVQQWEQDIARAERQTAERREHERLEREENEARASRERAQKESA